MDWNNHNAEFTNHDLDTFEYEGHQKQVEIIYKKTIDDRPVRKPLVEHFVNYDGIGAKDKCEEKVWIRGEDANRLSFLPELVKTPGFYLIPFGRADLDVFGGKPSVRELPCSKGTWKTITKTFHVHKTITRTILRDVAYFSSQRQTSKDSGLLEISYTARMVAELPDDLALSSTYIPSANKVYSVIYGCNKEQLEEIWDRVDEASAADRIDHPLIALGIFLELDRIRLIKLADKLADEFTLGQDILGKRAWDPNNPKMQQYLEICLQSRTLVDYIRAVKRQLVKVLAEIDDLEKLWARMKMDTSNDANEIKNENLNLGEKRERMIDTGSQMKQRIRDIMDEYDDKIDECKKMAQNLSLAMQTGWNQIARQDSVTNTRISHVNTMIALETKRESTQMRSIALLTMIYLPLSCVASVFSTTLFNWNPVEGEPVVSKYIWVLISLAVVLTFITVLAWHLWTSREKRKEEAKEAKSKSGMGVGFGGASMV